MASPSDVTANGCNECQFRAVDISVWSVESTVTALDAMEEIVFLRDPGIVVYADPWYELALEAGLHLVCSGHDAEVCCETIDIRPEEVTTVNVLNKQGVALYVFLPGESTWSRDGAICFYPRRWPLGQDTQPNW